MIICLDIYTYYFYCNLSDIFTKGIHVIVTLIQEKMQNNKKKN